MVKAQGCLFKKGRQAAIYLAAIHELAVHGGVVPVTTDERNAIINALPPLASGWSVIARKFESCRQRAAAFDRDRCAAYRSLQLTDVLNTEMWDQGVMGPILIVVFTVSNVDIEPIAQMNAWKTKKSEALKVPLLAQLVAASECVRQTALPDTLSMSCFQRYLISGA